MKEKILEFWGNHSDLVLEFAVNLIPAALTIIVCIIISKVLQRLIKRTSHFKVHKDGTGSALLLAVIRYGIFIICIIMVLNIFGINTSSLLAVLGVAGVAIGLALKDTLGNIASGILLLFQGSIKKGEFIEFDSFSGTVIEINLFTTILETPEGIFISAPNSSIWGSPMKNYTRNGKRRMDVSVSIAYSDSVEAAFEVMRNIITTEQKFLTDPAPQVILQAIEDGYAKITIRAWTEVQYYWELYWLMNKTVKEKIEAAGFKIPLPQREVHINN